MADEAPYVVSSLTIAEIRANVVIAVRADGSAAELDKAQFAEIGKADAGDRIMEMSDGRFDLYILDREREARV